MKLIRFIVYSMFCLVMAAPALAANPNASVSIDQPAPYTFGQRISFTTSPEGLWVDNRCYQNEVLVLAEIHRALPGEVWSLGPTTRWQGGPADCVARAGSYPNGRRFRVAASLEYEVSG